MTAPRPLLRVVRRVFMWGGAALVACAAGTAAYAEIAHRRQSSQFDRAVASRRADAATDAGRDVGTNLRDGDGIGRLEIPRIGISVMVLQGTEDRTLLRGAGHVPGTPTPGGDGNVVIAAHRDTFFRKLQSIRRGDRIRFAATTRTYEYVVESTETVDPEDTRVMESRAHSELTLITCYPFRFVGSAPRRFVVHARPVLGTTLAR